MPTSASNRLIFLAKKFDIFEEDSEEIKKKCEEFSKLGVCNFLTDPKTSKCLAIILGEEKGDEIINKRASISQLVFSDMIAADPSKNFVFVQWMLNAFVRLIKENVKEALRFVTEDLPQASKLFLVFEENKRKNKFASLCSGNFILKSITDYTDINQYKSLSQLFEAVDPFIEKSAGAMLNLINRYVSSKQAIIPFKDRYFTVYIPKTRDASVIFGKFVSWCTSVKDNGMFEHYTDNKKPNGKKSDLYIIINNKFLNGDSDELYQIHIETGQYMNKSNSHVNIREKIFDVDEEIEKYFYSELIALAKMSINPTDNKYVDALLMLGFDNCIFELMDKRTPVITLMDKHIVEIPDISSFSNVDMLTMANCDLKNIHTSIGSLNKLEMLSLPNNKIKEIPKEICNLKKLAFLNLKGNKISKIPDELKYLDSSNGGSLVTFSIDRSNLSFEDTCKLTSLLPNVMIH
jgi:hypothetical protein